MKGNLLKNVKPGLEVEIIEKENQTSGELTRGIIQDVLTNSSQHPHGIKVRLKTGKVGRVKNIID